MDLFFTRRVDQMLTPVAIGPFPSISPHHQQGIVRHIPITPSFQPRHSTYLGVVTVMRKIARLVRVPRQARQHRLHFSCTTSSTTHTRNLYKGYQVVSSGAFRATRNSNLYLHEEESRSLLDLVNTQLHNRRRGAVVRLEIEARQPRRELSDSTRSGQFGLQPWQVFKTPGPVNLSRLFFLADQTPRPGFEDFNHSLQER